MHDFTIMNSPRRLFFLLALCLGMHLHTSLAFSSNPESILAGAVTTGLQADSLFFGDPYVFLDGDTYYAYGTSRSNEGILVYTSKNLKLWQGPAGERDGFALHQEDVYGE